MRWTHENAGGFALPAAVFALVVIGVMVTSGFFLARQETQIGVASENASQALYIAEEGINQVRLDWEPPAYNAMALWSDTLHTGTTEGGEWEVTVTKTDSTNYFLEATGTVTEGGSQWSGATRRVGMLARVMFPTIDPPAAITTQGETTVSGNAEINGTDTSLTGRSCPQTEDKPGIMTNDTSQVDNQGQGNIDGDPPTQQDTTINNNTFTQFGELTYDDLVEMATWHFQPGSNMNSLEPSLDANGDCDYSDQFNWGDPNNPSQPCGDYYPIIHFGGGSDSRVTLQAGGVGQGILLVDGTLDLRGDFQFNGIVIVQGSFETQGSGASAPRITGGVYAGNANLESQNYTGGSVVTNSTCAVQEAVRKSATASRPLPMSMRSWVDLTGTSG